MNARDFKDRLAALLRRERHAMSDFLLALAEFDEKELWRDLGHASLFSFLRRELGLSAGAAQYRKTAAELIRRHSEVESALREGRLCLSSVIELAKVLTLENVAEVLPRFFGLSSRDAAALAVSIRPVEDPPVREVVLPSRAAAPRRTASAVAAVPPSASGITGTPLLQLRAPEVEPETVPAEPPAPAVQSGTAAEPRPSVEPLDAERARLHITVSRRLLAKLEAAKAALSHSHPGASSEAVFEVALDLLLEQHAKRKGIVGKPRKATAPVPPRSAAIPAAVRREVWTRAGGRCEWKLESGGVCGSTLRLEFDHITPRARGGTSTVGNLRVACKAHNLLAARLAFGDEWMDRFTRAARTVRANATRQRGRSAASQGSPSPCSRDE